MTTQSVFVICYIFASCGVVATVLAGARCAIGGALSRADVYDSTATAGTFLGVLMACLSYPFLFAAMFSREPVHGALVFTLGPLLMVLMMVLGGILAGVAAIEIRSFVRWLVMLEK